MINEARRNVPISYAKQIRGRKMFGGVKTYLPIMVNPAGVIPIIFAIAVLLLPSNLGRILTLAKNSILVKIGDYLSAFPQNEIIYMILYFALVVIFTYFYTAVTFQPDTIANNLQKIGAFIPGIRPGKETADFIKKILNRVVLVGAIFLGFVAITPHIVQKVTQIREFNFIVGGTSILIIVSVILETIKRIDSILAMKEYE
jgi:preprotein translocase subunit SecY